MFRKFLFRKFFFLWAAMIVCTLVVGRFPIASAQYQSGDSYVYPREPAPRLPRSARHVGGLFGSPYRNDRVVASGLPVGRNLQTYYGGALRQSAGSNPFGYRPIQKPFSNITRYRPLLTSREAARIEVSRGLWLW
ncbi:MAG: hypothetical protein GXP26_18430 [Planctomycetes bacterium]|nr:hypothetical protein [Planctomycetota bacterium]